jgi:hypothetical protein
MISVIVPALNEAALLPATLQALAANSCPHEVLVVDGGSADATVSLAGAAGARVLHSARRQRAAQMNLGAQAARGDTLLFLHADTRLPPRALGDIQTALAEPRTVGGAFLRWFDSPSGLLRWSCRVGHWRARLAGWFLGDQGIFARRQTFRDLAGFHEWDMFEDLDFSRRLKRCGRVAFLETPVVSSGRRFAARGPLAVTLRDVWVTCLYLAGRQPMRRRVD